MVDITNIFTRTHRKRGQPVVSMSSKLVAQSEDNSAKEKKPDVDVRISRTGTISIKGITGSLEGAKPNAKKKHSIRSAVASLRGQALRQLRQQQGIEEKAQGSKKKELPNFSFASPNRLFALVNEKIPLLLETERCTLYVADHGRELLWSANLQSGEEGETTVQIPFARGQMGLVAQTGQSTYGPGRDGDNHHYVPIRNVRDDVLGVLDVACGSSQSAEANEEMLELASAVAAMVGAAINHQGLLDDITMMNEQMHSATLTEQKMASIITWLFEVIGSGDGQEHKAEIQEMRDTFIRAHYGINMSNSPQGAGSLRVAKDSGVAAEFRLADMDEQSIEGSGYAQGQSSERAEDSGAPTWTEAFASIDTNKDGNISPSEFARWYNDRQANRRSDGPAYV